MFEGVALPWRCFPTYRLARRWGFLSFSLFTLPPSALRSPDGRLEGGGGVKKKLGQDQTSGREGGRGEGGGGQIE